MSVFVCVCVCVCVRVPRGVSLANRWTLDSADSYTLLPDTGSHEVD